MTLTDQLSANVVKLLDKVRGHRELDYLLGKMDKESEEKYVVPAGLYLAIKHEEKPVSLTQPELSKTSFVPLVRRSFELSAETGGDPAQSNSKYLQVEFVDFTSPDRFLHLSSVLRLGVLHSHLVVEVHHQSKSPLFLRRHFIERLGSSNAFSNSRASSSSVTRSPTRCSSF